MKANYKVFEYCKKCDRPLSGIKRKFCSYECGEVYRSEINRKIKGKEALEKLIYKAMGLDILNCSQAAFNEAKQLLK